MWLFDQQGFQVDAEVGIDYLAPNRVVVRLPWSDVEWLSPSSPEHLEAGNGVWVHEDRFGRRWAAVPYLGEAREHPDDAGCVFWDLLDGDGLAGDTGDMDSCSAPGETTARQARDESLAGFASVLAASGAECAAADCMPSAADHAGLAAVLGILGVDALLPKSWHRRVARRQA